MCAALSGAHLSGAEGVAVLLVRVAGMTRDLSQPSLFVPLALLEQRFQFRDDV